MDLTQQQLAKYDKGVNEFVKSGQGLLNKGIFNDQTDINEYSNQ